MLIAVDLGSLLICAGLVFLFIAFHPFVTYPISLKLLVRFRPVPIRSGRSATELREKIALLMCAYNEELVIAAKIENMLKMRVFAPNLEIYLYIDGASDRTAELANKFADQITIVNGRQRQGKTYGMNALLALTSAEILVFTDANVMFADDAILHLLRPFADPSVGCTLGHLHYVASAKSNATASVGSLYWRIEENIKELESQTGSAITSDGSIFAVRRDVYTPAPPEVSDDIYVSLSVLCSGYRVVRVANAVAFESVTTIASEEFKRKIRIACGAFAAHVILWPKLRRLPTLDLYKYMSHKFFRWLTIYNLATSAVCFLLGVFLEVGAVYAGFLLVFSLGVLGLVWFKPIGPLALASSVFQAFVATGIGVWKATRGHRFQTWNPPASAREIVVVDARSVGLPAEEMQA